MVSPPPCPNQPTTPWLFPEGGVSSSQVQGKQGRGGGGLWPSWGRISTSTLHWSKMRILLARAFGQKGAGSGDELCVFCNLDVSRPNCLLSQPKMDPSGAADYIREDSLFSQGRPDKRGASVPLAIWSQNNRKGPRKEEGKKEKKKPSQHPALNERNAVWIDGMAGQISKHTVKLLTLTQRLEPNLNQQIKQCARALMSRSANHGGI